MFLCLAYVSILQVATDEAESNSQKTSRKLLILSRQEAVGTPEVHLPAVSDVQVRQEGQTQQEFDAGISHPPAVCVVQLAQCLESSDMLQAIIMNVGDPLQKYHMAHRRLCTAGRCLSLFSAFPAQSQRLLS